MNKIVSKGKNFLLLGQCLPCSKQNASKVRVRRMVLDTNINMVRKFLNVS
jgi:small subunit ribosomal protein S17